MTCTRCRCLGVTGRQRQRRRRDHRCYFPPAFQRGWVFGNTLPFARHHGLRLSLPRGSLGGGREPCSYLTWWRGACTQCDYCDYGIIVAAAASSAVPKSIISIVYRFFYSLRSTVGEAARVSRVHTSPPPYAVRIRVKHICYNIYTFINICM